MAGYIGARVGWTGQEVGGVWLLDTLQFLGQLDTYRIIVVWYQVFEVLRGATS